MASTTSGDALPSGGRIFTSFPDIFFIPEFVFGGLVWILVASAKIDPANPLGWVMFVSIFCFIMTTLWFFIFLCGKNQSSIWPALDAGYHFVAVVFFLSASVDLAYVTYGIGELYKSLSGPSFVPVAPVLIPLPAVQNIDELLKIYRLYISAVVMSYVATLLYFLHAIFSAIRWKRS
ncbi:myelin and lymphocyte protein-like [Oreochromis aureus]|uniref:Myelin and lymphocyte protein n=1 Tax=Oreochromis aureus TaxID=47969 RepID=A0AAZ1XT83_OREAU|nr:myelin and lymphocyte protein-like [Oreochromis aureus]